MPDQGLKDSFLADLAFCLDSQVNRFGSVAGWCIAYSGGLDSQALLHAVLSLNLSVPVRAIHIHHGLSPNADSWLQHCQRYCDHAGIPLICEYVDVQSQGKGVEDAARVARYQAFEKHLKDGEVLLQGHHLDDQCETLILRLLRGSGSAGLSGMPDVRAMASGYLYRPLLSKSRQQIEAFAQSQSLCWIEDESNASDDYDRNYVRHFVLPQIEQRWPKYRQPLQQVVSLASDQQELLQDLAKIDYQAATLETVWSAKLKGVQRSTLDGYQALSVIKLLNLSIKRRHNLLRLWFTLQGVAQPRAHQWGEIEKLLSARQDAQPQVCWPGGELRRFKEGLYLKQELPELSQIDVRQFLVSDIDSVELPLGCLNYSLLGGSAESFVLRLKSSGDEFKPQGRSRKSLKKYLQELDVPPWIRPYVPVIEFDGRLVWVAGLGVAEGCPEEIVKATFVWCDV